MPNNVIAAAEANRLIAAVEKFWNSSVAEIKVENVVDKSFDMFTLRMKMYGRYDVLMEYDRGTLSIKLKVEDEFIVLSRLTNERVYRGFDGYKPENMLHNFKIFDSVLKSMR